MALIVEDRILETSTTTGTGAMTLAGAVTGFRAFASVCTSPSDTCYYVIEGVDGSGVPTGQWETGLGTYSAANTLTRTTVIRSSNSNAAVSFSAGTKRVSLSNISSATANTLTGWTDLVMAGSTTTLMGATFQAATQTYTLAAGQGIAIEAEFLKTAAQSAVVGVGLIGFTEGVRLAYQSDGNKLFYRTSGTANVTGSTSNVGGYCTMKLVVYVAASSAAVSYGLINEQRLPTTDLVSTAANLIGSCAVFFDTSCIPTRARCKVL